MCLDIVEQLALTFDEFIEGSNKGARLCTCVMLQRSAGGLRLSACAVFCGCQPCPLTRLKANIVAIRLGRVESGVRQYLLSNFHSVRRHMDSHGAMMEGLRPCNLQQHDNHPLGY